jgi:hypothetical protein
MNNLQLQTAVSLLAFNVQCHFGGNCPKIMGKRASGKPQKFRLPPPEEMSDNGKSGTGLFTFCLTKSAQRELNNA